MGNMSKAKSRTTKPILLSNMCNKKEHSYKINQESKLERLHETMGSQKTTA